MKTIQNAGFPRDSDLPTLQAQQLDALTEQLIDFDIDMASEITEQPVPAKVWSIERRLASRSRWRAPSVIAAAVVLVAAVVSLYGVDGDHRSDGRSDTAQQHIVQEPAPNFPCLDASGSMSQPTRWAAFLPWGLAENTYATFGLTDDGFCINFPLNGGGMSMSAERMRFTLPVVYFGTSGPADQSAYPTEMAFGVVDNTVTRVKFVPTDAGGREIETSTFVGLGDHLAFAFPYDTNGVVTIYSGDTVVATQQIIVSPTALHRAELAPTGLPCDPAAPDALANASRVTIDFPAGSLESEIYLDSVEGGQPTTGARLLCMLIATADPVITATANPLGVTNGVAYLTTTTVPGGRLLWGSLAGTATTIVLIDSTGTRQLLSPSRFDLTRSELTPFAFFLASGEPDVISAQGVDKIGTLVGSVVDVT